MGIDFDWQAGDDQGGWQVLAQQSRRRRTRAARWAIYLSLALIVAAGVGGYIALRRRYDLVYEQIVFQIQSVIDLEASAYTRGDDEIYLAQQDAGAPDWYALQQERITADCPHAASPLAPQPPSCAPVLPAEIQDVDLRDGIAWVEVIEDDPPKRKARFYRQTDLGWVHTAPHAAFWGHAIELHYGDVIARYHKLDQPHVDPLIERIAETYWDTCAQIGCAEDVALTVNFGVDATLAAGVVPPLTGHEWTIPSPWLSGLPTEGEWPEVQLDALAYLVARGLAAQSTRPLPQAQEHELVAWTSHAESDGMITGRVLLTGSRLAAPSSGDLPHTPPGHASPRGSALPTAPRSTQSARGQAR